MLKRNPKAKDRRRVLIPDDLRAALQEAWYLIKESKRDSDVRVDYDDAIQVLPWLIGGQVGSKKRPFEFTYYVGGDEDDWWHIALHPLDIEDFADGRMTDILLYCCLTPGCEHKTNDPDFLCECDYENAPYFGHITLADTAESLGRRGIIGISESSTRDDVVAMLGQPDESGGDFNDERSGYIPPWIKYRRSDCQLHFQFERSGKLEMLTIMDANWKPRM